MILVRSSEKKNNVVDWHKVLLTLSCLILSFHSFVLLFISLEFESASCKKQMELFTKKS